jgi:hypothetical protein
MSKQLVYLVAFGQDCFKQFLLCLSGLRHCKVDIALITDQTYTSDDIKIYRIDSPKTVSEFYTFRTRFRDYIDIADYDRVWYMDCDFLVFGDIFEKYKDYKGVLLSNEPRQRLGSEFFNGDLSKIEAKMFGHNPAINSGIYSAPKRYFSFFDFYHWSVKATQARNPDLDIPEQMALNSIYLRWKDAYEIELINDIAFPQQLIIGNEMAYHFACYKSKDKEGLMIKRWEGRR